MQMYTSFYRGRLHERVRYTPRSFRPCYTANTNTKTSFVDEHRKTFLDKDFPHTDSPKLHNAPLKKIGI